MPDPTFLHIQGRGDSTVRMLELPAGLVRVGRGAHCEVRLDGPEIGDVQCMLRRRGTTWHFQPVGPPGQVWVDGRPADQQRPLALGVPFRVGEHWLTLRPAESATNDWGSFDDPIPVEPEASTTEPDVSEAPPTEGERPRPAPAPDDNEERLRRWESRLEQRERWLKDRQEERRWEARWKSAGESIRARSTPPAPASPATPRPSPTPPASTPKTPLRSPQTPPVARIIEPRASEPIRRVADPTPRPSTPRVVLRPLADPTIPPRRRAEPFAVRIAARTVPIESKAPLVPKPEPPATRAMITLPPGPVEVEVVAPPEPTILPVLVEPSRPGPIEDASPTISEPTVEASTVDLDRAEVEPDGPTGSLAPAEIEPDIEVETTAPVEPAGPEVEPAKAILESSAWERSLPAASGPAEAPPPVLEPAASEPEVPRKRWPDAHPIETPAALGVSRAEWPSARTIFEAQGRRAQPGPPITKARRRRSPDPEPTDVLGPAQWTFPLWLGWSPAVLLTVALGSGGLFLAYDWAVEANGANVAIRSALRDEGSPAAAIDPASIPRGGWWSSNATHLAAWAMALQRSGDGGDHSEEVRSLEDSARHASRLSSRSRFVLEWPESADPERSPGFSNVGRTRDVVTLVWTARRLRKAGKADPAIRAYRSAMELASKAGLEGLDPPDFHEDPQVRRYALPREALLEVVAGAMAEDGEWSREQWAEALPPSSACSLVASRVLARKQKRADADRLADLAIVQAEAPAPPGFDPAESRAAGAEALASRGRWTDAAEQYRLAIDQADDDPTRRMWWLNLAEVAQRVGDDQARDRAIEAAKVPDSADEITRRALQYQQGFPGFVSSGRRP